MSEKNRELIRNISAALPMMDEIQRAKLEGFGEALAMMADRQISEDRSRDTTPQERERA